MNKLILTGNLTKNCESRILQNGGSYLKGSIANNRTYTNTDGLKTQEVLFFDFVIFGNIVKSINMYMKKGAKVLLEGRLQSNQYTNKDGVNMISYSLLCENVEILKFANDNFNTQNIQKLNNNNQSKYENTDSYNEEIPF